MNIRNGIDLITEDTYGFIYITTNMVNGKRYVGQKRINVTGTPWQDYIGSGRLIIKAIDKYGEDAFYKDIIDVAMDEGELNKKEIYWIQKYDAVNDDNFYNLDGGGYLTGYSDYENETKEIAFERRSKASKKYYESAKGNWVSAKLTEDEVKDIIQHLLNYETTEQIHQLYPQVSRGAIVDIRRHKNWKYLTDGIEFPSARTMTTIYRSVPVLRYDLWGNYIDKFNSITAGCNYVGGKSSAFLETTMKMKYRTAYGYIWVFEDDNWVENIKTTTDYLSSGVPIIDYVEKLGLKPPKYYTKPVLQLDKDNNIICRYESIGAAERATGASHGNIINVCKGKVKTAGGYKWRYADNEECGDLKDGTA